MSGNPERLTMLEIAAELEIETSTVRAYKARGLMPEPTGQIGRTPYWTRARIAPWLEQQRTNRRHVGRETQPSSS